MDGRGGWIALKFEKGGTLGSAGLSINLLTNILYRQAAALHPNLPLPAIAHPRTCCSLRPTTTCALLRACTTRPHLLRPTNHQSGRHSNTRQKHISETQIAITCPASTSPPSDTWLLGYYFKARQDRELTAWSRPLHIISILPRQNIHGPPHAPHGPSLACRCCHRCTVCDFVCVCLAQGTGDLGGLHKETFGRTGTPHHTLLTLSPSDGES